MTTPGREVGDVVRDEHLRAAADRRGEHVTVIDVGEFERVDEVLVAGHEAILHTFTHQLARSCELVDEFGLTSHNRVLHLIEDLFGPTCP